MHTIREITGLATMLAGLIALRLFLGYTSTTPHLRLDYALASISCEHCRSSRNNPHCAPRHVIYYFIATLLRIWLAATVERVEIATFNPRVENRSLNPLYRYRKSDFQRRCYKIIICTKRTLFLSFFPIWEVVSWDIFTTRVINLWIFSIHLM